MSTSDAVWLTDLEPIHGFEPAKTLDPKAAKTQGGKPTVKAEFSSAQYGSSSLADIQVEQAAPQKGRPAAAAAAGPKGVTANAVRIKGFWRENPKSQNVVSELLKNLREKSSSFRFTIPDPADPKKTIDLVGDQNLGKVLTIDSVPAKPGDLGMSFEITLPLTREVVIK